MTQTVEQLTWLQNGLLAELPDGLAWKLVIATMVAAALVVLISYWRTLAPLTPVRRTVLCSLRVLLLGGLLLVIAAPTRLVRVYERPERVKRPVAMLVDRSDSMTVRDNRGNRRIDDALQQWRRLEPAAAEAFGPPSTFAFAGELARVSDPAGPVPFATGDTRLLAALREVLAQAPESGWGSVVVLTDGVDTTGAQGEGEAGRREILASALGAGTPLHFVIGRNRVLEREYLRLREFNVPALAEPGAVVKLGAVFESSRHAAVTAPVELLQDGKAAASGQVRFDAGRQVETWSAERRLPEHGVVELELKAGDTIARAEVRIERRASRRILLLQDRLDWTQRFLARAVARDGSFELVPVWPFAERAVRPPGALAAFPPDEDLGQFGIVVIDNAGLAQLRPPRQLALTNWVNQGGVVLVIAADARAAGLLAGTELEQALPVNFVPGGGRPADPVPPPLLPGEVPRLPRPRLRPAATLAWENPARLRDVFGEVLPLPEFHSWAPVAGLKPAAEVLARHPTEQASDGQRAVLLALQRYGRGQSLVLATDPLWRWQLSLANEAAVAERFWITLFAWLTREGEQGFHFDRPPVDAPIDQRMTVRVVRAAGRTLTIEATSGEHRVPLRETAALDDARVFEWTPPAAGFWCVEARDGAQRARMWVTVEPPPPKRGELPASPADERLPRLLAAESGGSVLTAVPPAWRQPNLPAQIVREARVPLWHTPSLLVALGALYCVEMLLRRRWQLL